MVHNKGLKLDLAELEQGSRRNKILVLDSIYLNQFRSKPFL